MRFERGVNIADALQRTRGPELPATHVLVEGDDEIVATAELADEASRPTVEIYAALEGGDTTKLSDAGLAILEEGTRRLESARFAISIPKDDPHDTSVGDYLPGPSGTNGDFWIGDQVSLHTGSDTVDYTNRIATVAAMTISEDDASNIQCVPELDSIYHLARPKREVRYGRFEGFPEPQGRGVLPGRVLPRSFSGSGTLGDALISSVDLDVTAADVTYDNATSGLTADDVQAALDELATGAGGSSPWLWAQADLGLAGDGVTDDSAALEAGIDTATASGTQSGWIRFEPGTYLLSRALQSTGTINAQVRLPTVSTSSQQITIRLTGAARPPFAVHGSLPAPGGYSLLKSTLTGASGTAAVISGGNGSYPGTQNNISMEIENFICLTPADPSMTFWNLAATQGGAVRNIYISTTAYNAIPASAPTNTNAYGIKLPQVRNSNYTYVDGLNVYFYGNGVLQGELAIVRGLILSGCLVGVEFPGPGEHASLIVDMQATSCPTVLKATGLHYCDILSYDFETTTGPGWSNITYDLDDSSNYLHGSARYWGYPNPPTHSFTKNGGSNFTATVIGDTSGGSALTIKDEGSSLSTAATSIDFVGALVTASGTTAAKTVTVNGALDDLTDVTLTSVATADRLRYDGSVWRNSALIWRPMTTYDPTSGLWVPLVDGDGNAIMAEA